MTTQITFETEEGYSARISPSSVWSGDVRWNGYIRVPNGDVRWNGYIRVPNGHPLFGKKLEEIEENFEIDVHGELSYAKQEGETWTFGFDTCHSFDGKFGEENYKDSDYVKNECEKLSKQFAEIEKNKK